MTPTILSSADLALEINQRSGLIPVALDTASLEVTWFDLGEYHCYQGFFRDALRFCRALRKDEPATFRTSLDALLSAGALMGDALPPSGFIFHAGRCGSTLLTRALARSRQNIVFGEASLHNQLWATLQNEGARAPELYRAVLTAMGRRRLASYQHHLIKFTSWTILKSPFIRATFPGVPAVFLFRDPERMLASYHREPAPWMGLPIGFGSVWHTPESAVEDFFRAGLETLAPCFRVLEYSDLTTANLPRILLHLGVECSPAELRQMTSEFLLDAKSAVPKPFESRPQGPVQPVPEQIQSLYLQLRERAATDWQFQ